jgi:hypothetical protein
MGLTPTRRSLTPQGAARRGRVARVMQLVLGAGPGPGLRGDRGGVDAESAYHAAGRDPSPETFASAPCAPGITVADAHARLPSTPMRSLDHDLAVCVVTAGGV